MDLKDYKSLMSHAKAGEMKKVLDILRTNQLTSERAVNVIVCCCIACTHVGNKFSEEDLLSALKICSKAIESLDEKLLEKYLQSLFHILKYFIAQKNVKSVIALDFLLLPKYATNLSGKSNANIYQNCSALVHNYISTLTTNRVKIDSEDFVKLCVLSMRMYFEVSPLDILLRKIHDYFVCCTSFGIDAHNLHVTYLLVLDLLQQKKNNIIWNEDLYKSLFKCLCFLINALFKEKHFCQIQEVIHSTMNIIKENYSWVVVNEAVSIVKSFAMLVREHNIGKKRVSEIFETCAHKLNFLIKSYGLKPVTQSTCVFCCGLLFNIIKTYKTFSSSFWDQNFDDKVLIALYKLTSSISDIYCQVKAKCPCGECGCETDFTSAINSMLVGGHAFRDYCDRKSDLELTSESMSKLQVQFKRCCKLIAILKERGCSEWGSSWKAVGAVMYNICIDLHKINSKHRIQFKKLFLQYLILFEGCNDSVLMKNILKTCLTDLTNAYLEYGELGNALISSALNMYFHPKEREHLFLKWAQVKSACKESTDECDLSLQELNLVSVFTRCKLFVKSVHPEFEITDDMKLELLQFELEQYTLVWPSQKSIISALKDLHLIADVTTTTKALIQIWNGCFNVRKYLHEVSTEALKKYEIELLRSHKSQVYLSYLYFIHYKTSMDNMQMKTMKEMQKVSSVNEKHPAHEDVIPNDECDIVTCYEHLELEQHNRTMQFLHKSLDAFEKCIDNDVINILQDMKIYNVLVTIAFEYRLQCYTFEYIRACFLCLKTARITSNKLQIIESIGYIIEKGNMSSSSTDLLMSECAKEISLLTDDDTIAKWETLTSYYISNCIACLSNGDVQSSMALYKDAKCAYERCVPGNKKKVFDIHLNHLHWQFLSLPCNYEIEGHYDHYLVKPILTLNSAHEYFLSEGHKSAYFMSIFFEIYNSLIRKYVWLRMPRETRCYGKEVTFLAQGLLVPLRSVKLLAMLAQADLMSCRYDDCRVKIYGMLDIMCLSKLPHNYLVLAQRECIKAEVVHKSVSSLSYQFQEMMLDHASAARRQQARPKAPILETKELKLQSFVNHEGNCDCFACMSLDYQELILVILNLLGQLSAHQLNFPLSQEHYESALHIYNQLVSNEMKFRDKIFQVIHQDMFPSVESALLEIYGWVLLNISYNLMGTPEGIETNKKLLSLLDKSKLTNVHLYNEACIQAVSNVFNPQRKSTRDVDPTPMSDVKFDKTPPVTPNNKYSKVKIPSTIIYSDLKPQKPVVRKLKFDLSDNETGNEGDDKKLGIVLPAALSVISKVRKTPAPSTSTSTSNIKVYRTASKVKAVHTKLDLNEATTSTDKTKTSEFAKELFPGFPNKSPEVTLKQSTKHSTKRLRKVSVLKSPLTEIPDIVLSNYDAVGCTGNERLNSQPSVCTTEPRSKSVKQEHVAQKSEAGSKSAMKRGLR